MLLTVEHPAFERTVNRILRRLPPLDGDPVRIQNHAGLRDRRGPVHAGSFLRERRIAFDCSSAEFARILVHELFHFVWLRAGNPRRRRFEELLSQEMRTGARGELGWSAESRKDRLRPSDAGARTRRWRDYCCESFCDTAAWIYSGVKAHSEFTLAGKFRLRRRKWFEREMEGRELSI